MRGIINLVVFVVSVACVQGQAKGPGPITFTNPYGTATFRHATHTRHPCTTCHPPFDFKFDDEKGYSLRAHGRCISCHQESKVPTDCASCHTVIQREKRAVAAEAMRSASLERQRTLDFLFKRRSIRKFQSKPVADEVVHDLLKAAMAAPSAGSWQPWVFVVVKEDKVKKALSETSPFARYVKDAAVVVCVAGKKDNPWAPFDCALAAGNLLLAAANFNLGATYCGLDEEREEKARQVLAIPDDYFLYTLIPIGYPAEVKPPHTKYNPERIHWGSFEPGRPETIVDH